MKPSLITLLIFLFSFNFSIGQEQLDLKASGLAEKIENEVIEWRRHFHENPELSNREFETAKTIAETLTSMGLHVDTGIAKTGVIGVLDTNKPGPTIALRADIDGLPVVE